MKMISLKYNKKKIVLFLVFSLIIIFFFVFLFLNAEEFALKKPNSSFRYEYVGKLFYKNENLLKIVSILITILFSYLTLSLIKMLIRKNLVFKVEKGFLFQNEKSIIEILKIKSLYFKKVNNNKFIIINLIESNKSIENKNNSIEKFKNKFFSFRNSKSLSLNIDFIENNPKITLEKLQELIRI
jgi:hypothetical protein